MPNSENIKSPALVIGAGRTASSYVLDRLHHARRDFQNIIENDIYKDLYEALRRRWWCAENWRHVGEEEEVERRIIETIRGAFITLFPSERPHWVMKCIWEAHDEALLDELFPRARYLHLVRDPRTCIASMMERIGLDFVEACEKYSKTSMSAAVAESRF